MMCSDDPNWVMIQIQWWSRSSDDVQWWSRSNDDVQWWSKSNDDLDPVMIQIQWWWFRSSDDPDPKMKMTWRWRWLEYDENSMMTDDTEKKTCADKLCQANTFLVKRECWCNCNFGMYSLVFLIYCNPMFIPGCSCVMSCPRCSDREDL